MQISIIVAMAQNRVIGIKNRLPWHIPEDLAWFKKNTWGKPIVMGRSTYESIGKPLPGRLNVILTKNPNFIAPGCIIMESISSTSIFLKSYPEIMIIGGATLYQQFLPLATKMYLTYIEKSFEGDTFFPTFEKDLWNEIFQSSHHTLSPESLSYKHYILERKST